MLSSVSIIIVLAALFHNLRKYVRSLTGLSDKLKDVLLWSLCSLELGCIALEQGALMEEGGMLAWALSLVMLVTWHISSLDGLSPNALANVVEGSSGSLARVPAMLAGSLISYRLMSLLWTLELATSHVTRGDKISSSMCHLPWGSRALLAAMITEYLGTLVLMVVPRLYILNNPKLVNNDSSMFMRGLITGVLILLVVLLGMDISGAMFNPTLAAVLVGGCHGYTTMEHVLVYWIPPVLAAFSAQYLCTRAETSQKKTV